MTKCLVVRPDNSAELRDFTGSDSERADAMRSVLGGWLESVRGQDCYALCDEDAKNTGKLGNKAATILASKLGHPGIVIMPDGRLMRGSDYLAGVVIFYGGIEVRGEDGYELDVTPAVLAVAREIGLEFQEDA